MNNIKQKKTVIRSLYEVRINRYNSYKSVKETVRIVYEKQWKKYTA